MDERDLSQQQLEQNQEELQQTLSAFIRTLEETLKSKEEELTSARKELRRSKMALNELEVQHGKAIEKLRQNEVENILLQRKMTIKRASTRLQTILTSLLFLLATVLVSFGVNMLTLIPPNSSGWIIVALGAIAYMIATLLTFLLTSELKD